MTYRCQFCYKFISPKSLDSVESIETYDTGCESFEVYTVFTHKGCLTKENEK